MLRNGDWPNSVVSACLRVSSNAASPVLLAKSEITIVSFSASLGPRWKKKYPPMARTINAKAATAIVARRFRFGVCARVPDSAAGAAPDGVWAASIGVAPTAAGAGGMLAGAEVCSTFEGDDLGNETAELSAGAAMRPVSVSRLRRFKSLRNSEACW